MLLAAGRGERLRPITDNIPKALVKVGGKALIVRLIDALVGAGHADIVINHAWLGGQIEAAIGTGEQLGARVRYSPEPEGALETGGGILNALGLLGNEPFIGVNADIVTDFPFQRLPDNPDGAAHLILVDNPDHNTEGDFALDNDRVRNQGRVRFTFSGIGVYRPQLFESQSAGRFSLT
ncbi:MAG TPA: nucleotidyltransferase family protein, partial [Gammaproteobacteria bacterium]